MTGDNHNLPKGLLEKIEQAKQEKEVIAQANSVPLPGALRDAFSPQQDIVVGKYSVRAFYDLDFEILQQIDHPLAKMAMGGDRFGEKFEDLRGQSAWSVCWLLTHSIDEVDDIASNGPEAVLKASRKEFSRLQLGGLLEISKAVLEQFSRYFSTVVGLIPSETEEGSSSKKA
jgi:hypothetical protein